MKRQSLKRPKALFGIDGGIIAAAIAANTAATTGATLASAIMQRNATLDNANAQARAMRTNADIQAKSIQAQTNNNNRLQQQLIDIQKQQANQQKSYYDTMNANMALLAGNQNARKEREQNKIVAKNGGNTRRKLRNASIKSPVGNMYYDGHNLPFKVTDGGYAQLLGYTPEGYALYETVGNDHEHSHTYRGKRATGVGYEFANGGKVEGEGNQSSSTGELVLNTPNDAWFISKHSIRGFNPTKAVLSGMHPINAIRIQEALKSKSPSTYNNRTKAKCGKRVKGWNGIDTVSAIGGGVNILGNLIGAGLTASANKKAAGILNTASQEATDTLVKGYEQLTGIDPTILQDTAFTAPTVIAATTNSSANFNPEREALARSTRQTLKDVKRSTLSSAARNNLSAQVQDKAVAERNKIAGEEARYNMYNAEQNAARIQDAAKTNATLALEARQKLGDMTMDIARYNNDISNYKISSIADAKAGNINQQAQNLANAKTANAQAWGSAIQSIGGTLGNFANSYAQNRFNEQWINAAYGKQGGTNNTNTNTNTGTTNTSKYQLNVPNIASKAAGFDGNINFNPKVSIIPNPVNINNENKVGGFSYDPKTGDYHFDLSALRKRRLGGNVKYSLKRF